MDGPLVSVIIDNYNYGRFLREAVDSALNQTYPNLEVIVVDDGSSDNSREIIASYGGRIIPVLKENGGQASAFNEGFAVSKGEIVCFLDSDDVWRETKINGVVEAARSNPRAVLIYHPVQKIDGNAIPLGKPWPTTLCNGWIDARVRHSGGWWSYPPTSALCFRRVLLERVMNIPEDRYRICADAYLAGIAPFLGPVVGLKECLALYRLHGRNHWNNQERLSMETAGVFSTLGQYETQVQGLNQALERLGMSERVRLDDHLPYHYLKRSIGQGKSIPELTLRALRCPAEPNLMTRLKMVVKLWLTLPRGINK